MDLSSDSIFNRKNLIPLLFLGILMLAIPIGVRLVQQQQILRSKATGNEIQFTGTGVNCSGTTCVTTTPTINISLSSPFGPPGQAAAGAVAGGGGASNPGSGAGAPSAGGGSSSSSSNVCPANSERPGQAKFVGPYGAYDPSSDPKAEKCKKFETNCEIPQGWQATDACATKVGIPVSSSSGGE